jgi:phosphoribosylformylglycinamidine synthase I
MNVTVVVFPGSNCDHDVEYTYGNLLGAKVTSVWHKEHDLKKPDVVVLPGGFAYGDYLRTGALAKLSPVMQEVIKFSEKGGKVIGICNGFQILCEAGMLPGVLLQNIGTQFLSQFVNIKVENNSTAFTKNYSKGEVITCPIAHGEGNYYADAETISRLEGDGRVVFRYSDKNGKAIHDSRETNPNGAINSIAGISNEGGNVVGLMPHPERAAQPVVGFIGGDSGLAVFR